MTSNVVVNILGNNRSLDKALDSSRSRMSKFGGIMKSAVKAGGLAAAAGAVVAGKALFDMTKAAIEDEAAAKKLATTLRNTGATKAQIAATEDWITAQGKALGIADDDLRPALGRLATATGSVAKAQKLASQAMDVSAGSGASLDSVTKALGKAYNGNVAGLAKFGINVKDAEGKTVSFEVAQKRLARAFKGSAETAANTTAGKFARLKLAISEAGETIGYHLIPIALKLGDFLVNVASPAVARFGSALAQRLAPFVAKAREAFASLQQKIAPVGDWLREHPEVIKGIGIAFGVAAAAAAVFAIAMGAVALATSPITLTVLAIAALGAGIALLWKRSETFRAAVTAVGNGLKVAMAAVGKAVGQVVDFVVQKWQEIRPQVAEAWRAVSEVVSAAVDFIKVYIQTGLKVVQFEFNTAVAIVTRVWNMFGKNIIGYLRATFNNVKQILKGAFQIMRGIFKVFSSAFKGDWKGVWNGIKLILKGAANVLIGVIKQMWNVIKFAFKNAGVVVKAVFKGIWDGIKAAARTGASALVDVIRSIPGRLRSLGKAFLEVGKGLIGKFLEGIGHVGDFVGGFAASIWNAVKAAINGGIDQLNGLLEFDFKVHGVGFTVNAPDIPHLARGGITSGPQLAVVGDNPGGREAIIPLDKYSLGGTTTIKVTVVAPVGASPVDIGRGLQAYLDAYAGSGGRKVAG